MTETLLRLLQRTGQTLGKQQEPWTEFVIDIISAKPHRKLSSNPQRHNAGRDMP